MNHSASNNSLIDDVIERFELQWQSDDHGLIERLLGEHPAETHNELLLELLRADIGRCYAVGLNADLQNYFARFPELAGSPEATAAICFEDFRARRHRGRSLTAGRWSMYAAVQNEPWFIDLPTGSSQFEASAVFESDEAIGTASRAVLPASSFATTLPATPGCSVSGVGSHPFAPNESSRNADVLGDFEIVSLLGEGSFSKVYLARQVSLGGRYVAVKVVNQPLREASHLARLQHTGIVPLYSCHRTHDKWILCMPYSGSATLADWLKGETTPGSRTGQSLVTTIHNAQNRITEASASSGVSVRPSTNDSPTSDSVKRDSAVRSSQNEPTSDGDPKSSLRAWHQASTQPLQQLSSMPASEFSLWIARRLASALAHAHQRGIVHGDLKPANILIRNDGEPALIDFNLSQVTAAAPKSFRGGTLPYMAPEQIQAIISRTKGLAHEQSDIFALGVILYELVEGQLPFGVPASTAETDLLLAVKQRSITPAFRERQTCTNGLRSIIRKCLNSDPANRYCSAVTLLEDLDCEASNSPLRHVPESLLQSRLPKLTRRFPRLFSAGSITVVSLFFMGILLNSLLNYQRRSERLASIEAIRSFEQQSDLRYARFLRADSSPSRPDAIHTTSKDLSFLKQLVTVHLDPNIDLPIEDRIRVEERLLALAFIEAYPTLQSSTAGTAGKDTLQALVDVLPPSAKGARTGHLVQAIAFAKPALSRTALRAAEETTGVLHEPPSANADSSPSILPVGDSRLAAADQTLKALALLLQSEPRRSLELLESMEPVDSLRLIHWMTCGRALLEIGEPRRAIAAFTMAMRDSSATDISLNRGLAYFRMGSLKEADADFTVCIRQSPDEVSGYLNRYAVRIAMGRAKDAMLDLDRAIELQPESARLRLIRSREHRSAGRLKAAKDDFDFAMKCHPKSVNDWLSISLAKLSIDAQESLKDLESAETLYGPDTSILQTMAHVLSEHLNRPEDAILALDRLLKLEPSFQKALAGRSVLYARLGQVAQSLADVERLKSLDTPPAPDTVYQMACSLALCSRTQPELRARSLTLLAEAVRQNYGGELMAQDPDLEAIRNLPEFEIIQKNYELIARSRER